MSASTNPASTILRRPKVLERTGLKYSTLDRMIAAKKFPAPLRLSAHTVGWLESSVEQWIRNRVQETEATVCLEPATLEALTTEIARQSPDMMVQLERMAAPMRIGDALTWVKEEAARDIEHGRVVQVAAACHADDITRGKGGAGDQP